MTMFEQKFSNKGFAGSDHQLKKKKKTARNNTKVMLTRLILVYSEGLLASELQMIYPIRGFYLEYIRNSYDSIIK